MTLLHALLSLPFTVRIGAHGYKAVLHDVGESCHDVFAESPSWLPPEHGVGIAINTGDSPPVSKAYVHVDPQGEGRGGAATGCPAG